MLEALRVSADVMCEIDGFARLIEPRRRVVVASVTSLRLVCEVEHYYREQRLVYCCDLDFGDVGLRERRDIANSNLHYFIKCSTRAARAPS